MPIGLAFAIDVAGRQTNELPGGGGGDRNRELLPGGIFEPHEPCLPGGKCHHALPPVPDLSPQFVAPEPAAPVPAATPSPPPDAWDETAPVPDVEASRRAHMRGTFATSTLLSGSAEAALRLTQSSPEGTLGVMMRMGRGLACCALTGALCLLGCDANGGKAGPDSERNGMGPGGSNSGVGGSAGDTGSSGGTTAAPGSLTRFARLTHDQYQRSISNLFGIDDDVASGFAPDAQNGFSFDSSINYVVDSRLASQYRSVAESLAERVVTDPAVFARVVPCEATASGCEDDFIATFGLRAFRRPLSSAERTRFAALFAAGSSLLESGDAFSDGVRLVVEAMLQSPDFLYRVELSAESDASGRVPLSSFEMAARISHFLYNSAPDDELLRAAAEDELTDPEEVKAQVERLLDDPVTLSRIVDFHEQALDFGRYNRIALDPGAFPDVPDDLATRALQASRLFVADVVQGDGGLAELLTAPFAYVDASLAPLYGVDVAGDFERVALDPAVRPGLLTQVGFLASHAYSKKTDPIHRGLFIVRNLLCQPIPDPPAGASMTPPPAGAPTPKTTREEVEILTGQKSCTGCHTVINPPGFAFESFDAAGAFRDLEGDVPVDTAGSLELDGKLVDFADAPELIAALAQSTTARACYLSKWLDFAHGRKLTPDEVTWLADLPDQLSVLKLLPLIVSHESFMTRPTSEVSP